MPTPPQQPTGRYSQADIVSDSLGDNPLDVIDKTATELGLRRSSGTRTPAHNKAVGGSPTSYHLKPGQAGDYTGAPEKEAEFYRRVRNDYGPNVKELFYDPEGGYKNGRDIGPIGGHKDHVHVAVGAPGQGQQAQPTGKFTWADIVEDDTPDEEPAITSPAPVIPHAGLAGGGLSLGKVRLAQDEVNRGNPLALGKMKPDLSSSEPVSPVSSEPAKLTPSIAPPLGKFKPDGTPTEPAERINESLDVSAGAPSSEDDLYRAWYQAKSSGDQPTQQAIAKNYLESFPKGKYAQFVGRGQEPEANKPQQPSIAINLADFKDSGKTPTVADVSQRIAASLGFTPEEAQEYTRTLGRNPFYSFAAGQTPDETAAMKSLIGRTDPNTGQVAVAALHQDSLASAQRWLEERRRGQQADSAYQAGREELYQIAENPDPDERIRLAGEWALRHGGLDTDDRQMLKIPDPNMDMSGMDPRARIGYAAESAAGSMIRGAGEHFLGPIIKSLGEGAEFLTGTEQGTSATSHFGEWIRRRSAEREAVYGKGGAEGALEQRAGAFIPMLFLNGPGAFATASGMIAKGEGRPTPEALLDAALSYVGLKGAGKMVNYMFAPNIVRGLQPFTEAELRTMSNAVESGETTAEEMAHYSQLEGARRISEAEKYFQADQNVVNGLNPKQAEFLQAEIASGRITAQQAAQIESAYIQQARAAVEAGAPPKLVYTGSGVDPLLETAIRGVVYGTVPSLVNTAAGRPPASWQDLAEQAAMGIAFSGAEAMRAGGTPLPETGGPARYRPIEEVGREGPGSPEGPTTGGGRPPEPPQGGTPAVWHKGGQDIPVTIVGDLGTDQGGRRYVRIAESETGVPVDELIGATPSGPATVHTPLGQPVHPQTVAAEAAAYIARTPRPVPEQVARFQRGEQRAVFIPPGQETPDMKGKFESAGLAWTEGKDAEGKPVGIFIHNPNKGKPNSISRKEVKKMAQEGTYPELLGQGVQNAAQEGTGQRGAQPARVEAGTAPRSDGAEVRGEEGPPDRRGDSAEEAAGIARPEGEATQEVSALPGEVTGQFGPSDIIPTVDDAAHQAATSPHNDLPEPTEGQKKAGNYQMGHPEKIGGLHVTIENPEGSKRKPEWPVLKSHYGYIRKTEGADGDHIDVFVKPGTTEDYSGPVFVVDQVNKDGEFDEHKVMLGFANKKEATRGYKENYSRDFKVGEMREFSLPEFKDWLKTADTTKPAVTVAAAKPVGAPTPRFTVGQVVSTPNFAQGAPLKITDIQGKTITLSGKTKSGTRSYTIQADSRVGESLKIEGVEGDIFVVKNGAGESIWQGQAADAADAMKKAGKGARKAMPLSEHREWEKARDTIVKSEAAADEAAKKPGPSFEERAATLRSEVRTQTMAGTVANDPHAKRHRSVLSEARVKDLVVFHGGEIGRKFHVYVTPEKDTARTHGEARAYRLRPDTIAWPDPEVEGFEARTLSGEESLRLGSAVVRASDLIPEPWTEAATPKALNTFQPAATALLEPDKGVDKTEAETLAASTKAAIEKRKATRTAKTEPSETPKTDEPKLPVAVRAYLATLGTDAHKYAKYYAEWLQDGFPEDDRPDRGHIPPSRAQDIAVALEGLMLPEPKPIKQKILPPPSAASVAPKTHSVVNMFTGKRTPVKPIAPVLAKPKAKGSLLTTGPPPGGWTEADKVPAKYRKPAAETPKKEETPAEKRQRLAQQVKDALKKSKVESMENLGPKGWDVAETSHEAETSTARTRWNSQDGALQLNKAGVRTLAKIRGKISLRGLALTSSRARTLATKANELAHEHSGNKTEFDNYQTLRKALLRAADSSEEFAIHGAGDEMSRGHELFHVAQVALERLYQRAPAEEGVKKIPGYYKARSLLLERPYHHIAHNPRMIAHEVSAHIYSGDYLETTLPTGEQYGLTEEEATNFIEGYFNLIADTFGHESLLRFKQLNRAYGRVRDAILEERRSGRGAVATAGGRLQGLEKGRQRGAAQVYASEQGQTRGPTEQAESVVKQTETAEFKKWFGESEVKDYQGRPQIVYHGSRNAPISFRVRNGMAGHFGVKEAANDKVTFDLTDSGKRGNAAVMPVYLSIQNPVRMSDVHFDEYGTMVEDLVERGVLTKAELPFPWKDRFAVREKEALPALIGVLREKGFDGIVYENRIESPGMDSWIPFEPTQIKSATGNRGTFNPKSADILESLAPLPPDAISALEEIARSFVDEGRTDFDELITEFEDLLGEETFDEVADFLPQIVASQAKSARIPTKERANVSEHPTTGSTGGELPASEVRGIGEAAPDSLGGESQTPLEGEPAAPIQGAPTGESTARGGGPGPGVSEGSIQPTGGAGDRPAGSEGASAQGVHSAPGGVGTRGTQSRGGRGQRGVTKPVSKQLADAAGSEAEKRDDETRAKTTSLASDFMASSPEQIGAGGMKTKYKNNILAIKTLRQIELEGRTVATPEEQEILARFVGWGMFPQLFKEYADEWHDPELRELAQDRTVTYDQAKEARETKKVEKEKWQAEAEEFRALMTDEEYNSAHRSILNAHYTHPLVVQAMWGMAERMGFKGGRVLEPALGVGNFFAMMPADLRGASKLNGVELDLITGGMAKLLYPNFNIQVKGYQDLKVPDNFYDVVISNVPFGDYHVYDRDYEKIAPRSSIHDYYFLKSVDKTRPGGLVLFITSAHTMDKGDSRIRELVGKKADLVQAFRLPDGAFEKNAGTAVVTDVIILRKRAEGVPASGGKWMGLGTVPDPDAGDDIPINEYYVTHPQNVLGIVDRKSRMYGKGHPHVSVTPDLWQRLLKVLADTPEGVYQAPTKKANRAFEAQRIEAPGELKEGNLTVKDGKIWQKQGEHLVEQKPLAKMPTEKPENYRARLKDLAARLEGMTSIRDKTRAVFNSQIKGESDTDRRNARDDLNSTYDRFVKKYGFLSEAKNSRLFAEDPDSPTLLALEDWNAKTKKAQKRAIFSQDVITHAAAPEKATDVGHALSVALAESGTVDLERMAALLDTPAENITPELVEKGLAYNDPKAGWAPAAEYLSGNVRRKVWEAREAALGDEQFRPNVEALEKVQPEDVSYDKIYVRLGAPWLDKTDVQDFAAHLMSGQRDHFSIGYIESSGQWLAHYTPAGNDKLARSSAAISLYGTPMAPFMTILQNALDGRVIRIMGGNDENGDAVGYSNDKGEWVPTYNQYQSGLANAKISEVREQFQNWIWTDDERRARLHRYYNDTFNNVRSMQFDGSHLTIDPEKSVLRGMNPGIHLRTHQIDGVWRMVANGRVLYNHEVGTGKTYTMIAAAMELRRMGLAKKPAIAALKANVEDISAAARNLYPGIKLISIEGKFSKKERRQTISRVATGDYDLVILTHDNLNQLPMNGENEARFIQEELDELDTVLNAAEEADAEAAADDGGGYRRRRSSKKQQESRLVKQLRKQRERLEAKLRKAVDRVNRDTNVTFEETGIDAMFVDEAHMYKSLPIYTRLERIKGIPTNYSQRAANMLMRTRWLLEQNGGRGVAFATGTPVANTIAELFNVQRYLQWNELVERGIQSFDAWAKNYTLESTKMTMHFTGDYAPETRLDEFVNVPDLQQLTQQIVDTKQTEDLPQIVRPIRHDEAFTVPMSRQQRAYMMTLRARMEIIKARKRPPEKGDDIPLSVNTDARKMSVDIRLVMPNGKDYPDSKVNRMIQEVIGKRNAFPGSTQLVFSDIGVHANAWGFRLYDDIIAKLVKAGIPKDKIIDFAKFASSDAGKAAKAAAMERLRTGDAVIGIGSTQKLGTGVNVQDKLIAIHHLDSQYVPANVEQRIGRVWRQGNTHEAIYNHPYVTAGSIDARLWSIVGRKMQMIKQFLKGDATARTFKTEAGDELSAEVIAAIASGNTLLVEKIELEEQLKNLEAAEKRHTGQQYAYRDTAAKLRRALKGTEDQLALSKADRETFDEHKGQPFSLTVKKMVVRDAGTYREHKGVEEVTETDPNEAAHSLQKAFEAAGKNMDRSYRDIEVGQYKGFTILRQKGEDGTKILQGEDSYRFNLAWKDVPVLDAEGKQVIETKQHTVAWSKFEADYKQESEETGVWKARYGGERVRLVSREAAGSGFRATYEDSKPKFKTVLDEATTITRLDDALTSSWDGIEARLEKAQKFLDTESVGVQKIEQEIGKPFKDQAALESLRERVADLTRRVAAGEGQETADESGLIFMGDKVRYAGQTWVVMNTGKYPEAIGMTSGETHKWNSQEEFERETGRRLGQGDEEEGPIALHSLDETPIEEGIVLGEGDEGEDEESEVVETAGSEKPAKIRNSETAPEVPPEVNTFYIATPDRGFEEVEGRPVNLRLSAEFGGIVEPFIFKAGGLWRVTDARTGRGLGKSAKADAAKQIAKQNLENAGPEAVKRMLDAAEADDGLTPREKAREKLRARKAREREGEQRGSVNVGLLLGMQGGATPPTGPPPPTPPSGGPFEPENPEIARRWKEAQGIRPPPAWEAFKDKMRWLKNFATRDLEHLPRTAANAELHFALKRLEQGKGIASDEAVRILQGLTTGLSKEDYDLFTFRVIYNDFLEEVQHQGAADVDEIRLPFDYTPEELQRDSDRLNQVLASKPEVRQAVSDRGRLVREVSGDYLAAAKRAIGFEPRLNRQAYYHHQVLAYAEAERRMKGTGGKIKAPTGRGFLKKRHGSTLDINTDYLQAEHSVLAQMLYDTQAFKLIHLVDENHNIAADLARQVKQANDDAVQQIIDQEEIDNGTYGSMGPPSGPVGQMMRSFRMKKGRAFSELRGMSEAGDLWTGDNNEWEDAVDRLGAHRNVDQDMNETNALFRYLSALAARDEIGSLQARMILKAVSDQRKFIEDVLGENFQKLEDLIPEGYRTWQPREGNVFFRQYTLPERLIDQALADRLAEIGFVADDLRMAMVMGGKRREFIVPDEVADTLDNFMKIKDNNVLDRAVKNTVKGWKVWQLISPHRYFKYNFRNMSGDAEAVFLGNPRAFLHLPKSASDLYDYLKRENAPTPELQEWLDRGGLHNLFQVAEDVGDISGLKLFRNLTVDKGGLLHEIDRFNLWKKYWRAARLTTDFREALLRYAAFLDYRRQMMASGGRPANYGASLRHEINAMRSIPDKAYKLSNDLLGAYDEVSGLGQWLRARPFPFWSWQEVNPKRYWRLLKNAAQDGQTAEDAARNVLGQGAKMTPMMAWRIGKFLLMASGLWTVLQVYNNLVWPEEERDLEEKTRARIHVIYGRSADGTVLYFDRLGTLGDMLSWFGADEAPRYVSEFLNNKKTLKEIAKSMLLEAPTNKLMQSTGLISTVASFAFGRNVYPDVWRSKNIRDRWQFLFNSLSLGDEYGLLAGKPSRGLAKTVRGVFMYEVDPGESAMNTILSRKSDFNVAHGKAPDVSSANDKANAAYYMKLALRVGDREAAERYLAEYASLGGTPAGLQESISLLAPLAGLNAQEKEEFLKTLTPDERDRVLPRAQAFFEMVINKSSDTGPASLLSTAIPKEIREPVDHELHKYGISFPYPQNTVTIQGKKEQLPPARFDAFQQRLAEDAYRELGKLIESPKYQALNDTRKKDALESFKRAWSDVEHERLHAEIVQESGAKGRQQYEAGKELRNAEKRTRELQDKDRFMYKRDKRDRQIHPPE